MLTLPLKQLFGAAAVLIAIVSYIPYFHHIFQGKTKPHALTWLVWTVFTGMGFVQQWMNGGGAGSWAMGITALLCLAVFLLSLKYGEKEITLFDWLSLLGAAVALVIWFFSQDPVLAMLLVALVDLLGFLPTVRKSYYKPYEETLLTYFLTFVKYLIVLFALESYSLSTWLYPVFVLLTHISFVLMVEWRRRKIQGAAEIIPSQPGLPCGLIVQR